MEAGNRHIRLFNRIAHPYSWFFAFQMRGYARCFEQGRSLLGDARGKSALDLGCGTGAFTATLRNEGWDVRGIDAAERMVEQAKKRGLPCSVGDILAGTPYADKSFDLVSAAYVAHGLAGENRHRLFREAKRLSRGLVLFHDYAPDEQNPKRDILTSAIEYAEGGDYFNFIKTAMEELRSHFSEVRVAGMGKQAAWYVCRP